MLLLHICCGPCATYPIKVLKEMDVEFKGFFYNPNIHPKEEHLKRIETVKILSQSVDNLYVYYNNKFMQDVWENFTDEDSKRCNMCYFIRLEETAKFAKQQGFSKYSTTLLVSPYQNHELIKELGIKTGNKYDIEFYYEDFRPGFRKGQNIAKELGLYRQKFCGCIKSKANI